MDHGEFATGRSMRMGITVIGFTMRSPSCMSNSNICMKVDTLKAFLQFSHFTFLLMYFQTTIQKGNTRTVITSVFKSFQAFQDNWISFSGTDVSNNATHKY